MKRLLTMLALVVAVLSANAQDIIVKKDGSTIKAKVQRITSTEVKYKEYGKPKGATLAINTSELLAVNYEDGERITFGNETKQEVEQKPAVTTTVKTPMQMTNEATMQNMSDWELEKRWAEMTGEKMHSRNYYKKKANMLKLVGLIGGGVMVAGGAVFLIGEQCDAFSEYGYEWRLVTGVGLTGIGAAVGTYCLIKSSHYNKLAHQNVYSSVLFERQFDLGKGNSLALGVDAINDNFNRNKTLGLGMRFNF